MSIDARQLVRIIKACRQSGVSQLKLGQLEIQFGPGDAVQTKVVAVESALTPTDSELKDAAEAVYNEAVMNQADEELAHMQVENPALFEELLVNRELVGRGEREEELFD